MSDNKEEPNPIELIREICKGKTEEEILEAEEYFRQYLLLVKEICDRLGDQSDFDDVVHV